MRIIQVCNYSGSRGSGLVSMLSSNLRERKRQILIPIKLFTIQLRCDKHHAQQTNMWETTLWEAYWLNELVIRSSNLGQHHYLKRLLAEEKFSDLLAMDFANILVNDNPLDSKPSPPLLSPPQLYGKEKLISYTYSSHNVDTLSVPSSSSISSWKNYMKRERIRHTKL